MALLEISSAAPRTTRPVLPSRVRALLAWPAGPRFGWPEALALSLFFVVGAFAMHFHEHWSDEAQAWLIARDSSVWQILRYRLHYEGAPPLWHLLLHAFQALGGGYAGFGWLALVPATAGVYVWLRWSPFPAVIRYLLPFTFFLQYQYAVVARSYVLFPLCLFALCALYTRPRQIVWFALAAGLLANISLQGFIVAVSIGALFIVDRLRARKRWDASYVAIPRSRLIPAWTLFGVLAFAAFYCAIPAPDLNFAIGDQVSTGPVHSILVRLIGETPRNVSPPPPEAPFLIPPPAHAEAPWRTGFRADLALAIYPEHPPEHDDAIKWTLRTIGPHLLDWVDLTTWPVADSNLLGCAFFLAALLWLRARRRVRMLLPWFGVMLTGQVLWIAEHHAGLLLVCFIAGLWLAADTSLPPRPATRLEPVLLGLSVVVLVLQIAWSAHAIRADAQGTYDPGTETATWLKAHARPRMAAFGYQTVATQPAFTHSPYINVPESYWIWSSNIEVDRNHEQVIASHPDLVVYGLEFPHLGQIRDQWLPLTHVSEEAERTMPADPIVHDLKAHGYRETHRFCGDRFSRASAPFQVCDLIFEPGS